jgi:hypothetical protein
MYFGGYLEIVLTYVASFLEVAITLDCYLSIIIATRFKFLLNKASFYTITGGSVAFAFLYHVYVLLEYTIKVDVRKSGESSTNSSVNFEKYYYSAKTSLGKTETIKYLVLVHSLIRDALILLIILPLNLLILKEIRTFTKRRIQLAGFTTATSTSNGEGSESVLVAQRAEKRKCVMIIVTCLVYSLGHLGNLVSGLQAYYFFDPTQTGWYCVYFLSNKLLVMSYAFNFFIYYFFNSQFKRYANETMALIAFPVRGFLRNSPNVN